MNSTIDDVLRIISNSSALQDLCVQDLDNLQQLSHNVRTILAADVGFQHIQQQRQQRVNESIQQIREEYNYNENLPPVPWSEFQQRIGMSKKLPFQILL
jgi:RNAse (barnase) inhibitor barstar